MLTKILDGYSGLDPENVQVQKPDGERERGGGVVLKIQNDKKNNNSTSAKMFNQRVAPPPPHSPL